MESAKGLASFASHRQMKQPRSVLLLSLVKFWHLYSTVCTGQAVTEMHLKVVKGKPLYALASQTLKLQRFTASNDPGKAQITGVSRQFRWDWQRSARCTVFTLSELPVEPVCTPRGVGGSPSPLPRLVPSVSDNATRPVPRKAGNQRRLKENGTAAMYDPLVPWTLLVLSV